ncbi:phosphatidate cytidylyltransferase [Basilea psittacipulmonis]|uniref:Phosphatidate cytidylyltransferase n=1 Tax=Basilea psittacipulmonis DSM 24701 TaxID=1072685 RepID=A0A077DDE4_9BURK|nr:phosphatidate cytidylyltransferase [Basilea psittacipulmonis]AIL32634.1 hypothetical protein IX83_04325 [Basilea psittacipulmonis DSM 24701]
MLLKRIITAVVLFVILLITTLSNNPVYFGLFSALLASLCVWEMLRMIYTPNANKYLNLMVYYAVPAAIYGLFCLMMTHPAWIEAVLGGFFYLNILLAFSWLIIAPMIMIAREKALPKLSVQLFIGIFCILSMISTWMTVYTSYTFGKNAGILFLISWMAIVWAADIMAYFGGKYFGGRKLVVSISPGKTLSGALCGIAAGVFWTCLSVAFNGSFGHALYANPYSLDWSAPIIAGLVISVLSIVGDLFESMIKRYVGVKDSSQLLPGHGGVWDRMDSLLAIAPVIYIFWYLSGLQ